MDTRLTEIPEEPLAETPEDVAILYSWANLHGAKYRDFSASRREYRAQVRHRAAEEMRLAELKAKSDAEAAAIEAERIAREAERVAHTADTFDGTSRERALREAEDAARRAAAERVEAARRAEAAAIAEAIARREEREIAEAHASAQRQAKSYTDSEIRRRSLAGPQPTKVPSLGGDPYEVADHPGFDADRNTPIVRVNRELRERYRDEFSGRSSGERSHRAEADFRRRPQGFRPDESSGMFQAYRPNTALDRSLTPIRPRAGVDDLRRTPAVYPANERPPLGQPVYGSQYQSQRADFYGTVSPEQGAAPAWLFSSSGAQRAARPTPVADTLQHNQERVASRWFALKGVFEPGVDEARERAPEGLGTRQRETRPAVLAVFSLAGGVGKTSMVATLGRALSSLGEKVLLTDTTSHGLLPYYFGATELRPGVVRTFSPPSGSTDAPIHLVSYDLGGRVSDEAGQEALVEEMARSAGSTQRVLLDLNASSGWLIRRLGRMNPIVLVPVAPDMNSVISLQTVERYFQGATDNEGRAILPYYVLNGFDTSLPLHLDVREVLRGKLVERLLPIVIRRSAAVSEALAEGMTVVDYAPEAGISEDYMHIAEWLRSLSAPATQSFRSNRWSER